MKFRGWYIPIWIAGLSCLIYGAKESWFVALMGLAIIALPFVLWFAVKPKIPKEYKPEIPAEPISMAGSGEERYEKVRFAVVNVNEHQKELKKAYKVQEDGDIFDRPSCIMYARGSYENPGYAVYLEHDRIGDADENKCREIYDLLGQGELTDISYTINAEFDDDINDLYYTCIVTMTAKMP